MFTTMRAHSTGFVIAELWNVRIYEADQVKQLLKSVAPNGSFSVCGLLFQ